MYTLSVIFAVTLLHLTSFTDAQSSDNPVRWCVISQQELNKCRAMSAAFKVKGLTPALSCFRDVDHAGCMKSIADDKADVVTIGGGDIFSGGKKYNLRPLLAEIYDRGDAPGDASYWAVAVVKSNSSFNINDLKGKKSCHTGIMKTTGWVVPVGHLIHRGDIKVTGCDIPTAVGNFFSASCVPGAQTPANDPFNTNPDSLCQLCAGIGDNKCAPDEPYAGHDGAFRCLVEDAGDVAFVKHSTVRTNLANVEFTYSNDLDKNDFQLLCLDGTRGAVDDWLSCNLAKKPSNTVVTSAHKTTSQRTQIANMLLYGQKHFGNDSNTQGFKIFDSSNFTLDGNVGSDLLFKDDTINLKDVGNRDKYDEYLGPEYFADLNAMYCAGGAVYSQSSAFLVTILSLLVAMLKAI